MQAILTRILPATNTKPRRIKASCSRDGIVYSIHEFVYDNDLQLHQAATREMINTFVDEDFVTKKEPKDKNPWNKIFVTGQLENGDYCHVFI